MPFARFLLKESLGALRIEASTSRPVYVRLEKDAVLTLEQPLEPSGLVEVRCGTALLTVFCEDLVAKGELLAEPEARSRGGEYGGGV